MYIDVLQMLRVICHVSCDVHHICNASSPGVVGLFAAGAGNGKCSLKERERERERERDRDVLKIYRI